VDSKTAEVEEKDCFQDGKCKCLKVALRDFVRDGISKPRASNDFLLPCYTFFFFSCFFMLAVKSPTKLP